MTEQSAIKGSFTLPDLDGFVYHFVYNPPNISVAHKAEYGAICVPGASHPVYQYGSGGEQIISFELFIDGERGIVANGAYRRGGANGLNIRAEVNLLESLVIPLRYDPGSYAKTRPPILIFNFGSRFVNVECIMKSVSSKYTQFTASGDPVKASVSVQLAVLRDKSETALERLNNGAAGNFLFSLSNNGSGGGSGPVGPVGMI